MQCSRALCGRRAGLLVRHREGLLVRHRAGLLVRPVPVQMETIRWKIWNFNRPRKGFGKGRAPSKMYVIKKPAPLENEEYLKLVEMYKEYRLKEASVRLFIKESVAAHAPEEMQEEKEEVESLEEIWVAALEANEKWNERVAANREIRLQTERGERELHLEAVAQERNERTALERTTSAEVIQRTKEAVDSSFDMGNMEAEIERMLDTTPKDFTFGITPFGETFGQQKLPESEDVSQSNVS